MKIGLACDHRGYDLKLKLKKYLHLKGHALVDFGTNTKESVDYPDYAFQLGEAVSKGVIDYGIAICGSGIGISIACNKVKGIRCAKVDNIKEAKYARLDNDANILALNGTMPLYLAKDIIDIFFTTSFSNIERHEARIQKISEYENKRKRKVIKKEEEKEIEEPKDEC